MLGNMSSLMNLSPSFVLDEAQAVLQRANANSFDDTLWTRGCECCFRYCGVDEIDSSRRCDEALIDKRLTCLVITYGAQWFFLFFYSLFVRHHKARLILMVGLEW